MLLTNTTIMHIIAGEIGCDALIVAVGVDRSVARGTWARRAFFFP